MRIHSPANQQCSRSKYNFAVVADKYFLKKYRTGTSLSNDIKYVQTCRLSLLEVKGLYLIRVIFFYLSTYVEPLTPIITYKSILFIRFSFVQMMVARDAHFLHFRLRKNFGISPGSCSYFYSYFKKCYFYQNLR